jgi:hypothetical protein
MVAIERRFGKSFLDSVVMKTLVDEDARVPGKTFRINEIDYLSLYVNSGYS